MEQDASSLNPLRIFWQSAEVRNHVLTAGKELAMAAHAGLQALREQAQHSGLTEQYPYLQSALTNLQETVGQWAAAVGFLTHNMSQPRSPRRSHATRSKPRTARRRSTTTPKKG